ncbi:MAG: hypothetical protein JXB85_13165 [Anaerolineales bacterium]|nr:hypothetical protein [Anaerolineales bacterium]
MPRWIDEIQDDLAFLRSHTLQPRWFKITKVFILLGFLGGFLWLSGWVKTALFSGTFLFLMLLVHFAYRIKTKKYTQNWLDFAVAQAGLDGPPKRIGKFYYPAILINTLLALGVSQLLG